MKICKQCGAEVADNASFCAKCGAKMEATGNAGGAGNTGNMGNGGANMNQGQYQQYYQAPVDPYDHTAEFDQKDISDNKVFAMIAYLIGTMGIIIALLASHKSPYAMFHVRQALKFTVLSTLTGNRGADPGVDIYRTDCGRVVYSCTVCVQDYCVFLNLRRQGKRALHYQKL